MSDDDDDELSKDDTKKGDRESMKRKKKKGGKAKGTLETSVEIRNRMIGMSEAGLSTLSIALAINRSVSYRIAVGSFEANVVILTCSVWKILVHTFMKDCFTGTDGKTMA